MKFRRKRSLWLALWLMLAWTGGGNLPASEGVAAKCLISNGCASGEMADTPDLGLVIPRFLRVSTSS